MNGLDRKNILPALCYRHVLDSLTWANFLHISKSLIWTSFFLLLVNFFMFLGFKTFPVDYLFYDLPRSHGCVWVRFSCESRMLDWIRVTFESGRKEHNCRKFLLSYLLPMLHTHSHPEGLYLQPSPTIILNLKKKIFLSGYSYTEEKNVFRLNL